MTDDIRKQVQSRIDQEAEQDGQPDDAPKITSKLINECLFANEHGDGVLYATLFRDRFVYCKNMKEWYEWNGHHWQRDVMDRSLSAVEDVVESYLGEYRKISGQITELVAKGEEGDDDKLKKLKEKQKQLLKRASQLQGDKRRTACVKFAHTITNPLAISGDEFDQNPWLLACPNGVIDLRTGKLKDGRPSDYILKASPFEWKGIDEPAVLWEKTLLEIFNGNKELVAYIQRLFGCGITGIVTEKIFPVLWGKDGWNGRSLIIEIISHVMGPLAGPIPSEMLLSSKYARSSSGPSPDIMSLRGLRMAFASETDEGHKFSASKVKWLTGKDELTGRHPHDKYPSTFLPSHMLFLITNAKPQAPAHDRAFWERLHLIPFTISFVNRDPQKTHERRAILDLDEQLKKEGSGLLAWLVRGCLLWQKCGLDPPRVITEATEAYRRDEDLLADYIDECCLIEPGAKAKSSDLYGQFEKWYLANVGKKVPSGTWFGKNLAHKFDKNKQSGCVFYHGIGLIDIGESEGL